MINGEYRQNRLNGSYLKALSKYLTDLTFSALHVDRWFINCQRPTDALHITTAQPQKSIKQTVHYGLLPRTIIP